MSHHHHNLYSFSLPLLVIIFHLTSLPPLTTALDGLLPALFQGRASDVIESTFGSIVTSINTCLVGKTGWSDPILGEFKTERKYCDPRCLRSLFCCAPEQLEELNVQFSFTSAKDPTNSTLTYYGDKKVRSNLSSHNRTVVITVHGFLNHHAYETVWNQTRDGFLARGHDVIVVDWSRGNRLYLQSMANVRVVGALIGQLIMYLNIANRTLCVGFSLGSHICGEAGSWLKAQGQFLARCHGIDPAGPGYDGCGAEIRLDPSDCGVVTAIHSSQFVEMLGFGTKYKSGHCDFWMNDARHQPNCDNNPSFPTLVRDIFYGNLGRLGRTVEHVVGCAHIRSMRYYLSQVTGRCNFTGIEMSHCGLGKKCFAIREKRAPKVMELPPDDTCHSGLNLDFRVETTGFEPFCQS